MRLTRQQIVDRIKQTIEMLKTETIHWTTKYCKDGIAYQEKERLKRQIEAYKDCLRMLESK